MANIKPTQFSMRQKLLMTYNTNGISESHLAYWEQNSSLFAKLFNKYEGNFVSGEEISGASYISKDNYIQIGSEYTINATESKYDLVLTLSHELTHAVGQYQHKRLTDKEYSTKTPITYKTAWTFTQALHTGEAEAILNQYLVARDLNKSEKWKGENDVLRPIFQLIDNKFIDNNELSENDAKNIIQQLAKLNETAIFSGQPKKFLSLKNQYEAFYYTYAEYNQAYFLYHFTNLNQDYKEVMNDNLFHSTEYGLLPYGSDSNTLRKMAHIKSLTNISFGEKYTFYGTNNLDNFLNLSDNDVKHNTLKKEKIENRMSIGSSLARQVNSHELLYGGNGQDELIGNDLKEILLGGAGNDTLKGNADNDILGGNAGNDILYGGIGNDKLNGGKGKDTYYILDHDTIIDSDMSGRVYFEKGFNGKFIQAKSFTALSTNVWLSTDNKKQIYGEILATREGNHLTLITGGHSVVINDFFKLGKKDKKSGTWRGLDMVLENATPQTITQNDTPQKKHTLFRYTHDYINKLPENATNAQHDTARFQAAVKHSGSDLDDMLMNVQNGSAVVHFNGGNDWAYGGYGYDWLFGGLGNDILIGSALVALKGRPEIYGNGSSGKEKYVPSDLLDRDYLVGGAGSDLIFGVDGNDTIFTDEDGSQTGTKAGHLLPEHKTISTQRGDLAAGGNGNDTIYGSQMRDLLSGGAGTDVIYGGAGRDVLVGDGEFFPDIKRIGSTSGNELNDKNTSGLGNVYIVQHLDFDPSKDKITDAKHANNQNAWDFQINNKTHQFSYESAVAIRFKEHAVKVGGMSDYLFGGTGHDLLIGQFGNDYLDGGDGSDYLWGDDYLDKTISGHDTLKGGKGNDVLYGGLGNDLLFAGSGSDKLFGGKGKDTYFFTNADLQAKETNIINDEDGLGAIVIDGVHLHTITWQADPKNATHWTNPEHGLDLRLNGSNLNITSSKFAATITVQNFKSNILGLSLLPAKPSTRSAFYDDEPAYETTQLNQYNKYQQDENPIAII